MENKDTIIATSISPKHIIEGRQAEAIASWKKYNVPVVSFNHPDEIAVLKDQYPDVQFIATQQTQHALFGKHYVLINEFVNLAKETGKTVVLINSDCELVASQEQFDFIINKVNSEKCFFYLHRHNFTSMHQQSAIYKEGVDLFVFTPHLAKHFPMTMYCLGHTFFDIFYPYYMLTMDVPVYSIQTTPLLFHKNHQMQYNEQSWRFFGNYTNFLIGDRMMDASQVSKFIYRHLWTSTKELK